MFLIMLFGITGNASIIIIILRNKLLRLQPTNLFLLNMAVSDFINLCICPILYIFKRDILFTNYYLPKWCCIATPYLTGTTKNEYYLPIHLNNLQYKIFHCTTDIFYSIVTIFLSGALSLTAITFNRVIGIAMPRLANMLEMNRYIVYAILAFIWIVSLGTAVPTFDYRRYNVSSLNLCLHTACHMDHRKLHQVNFVSVYQALGKQVTHRDGRSQYIAPALCTTQ